MLILSFAFSCSNNVVTDSKHNSVYVPKTRVGVTLRNYYNLTFSTTDKIVREIEKYEEITAGVSERITRGGEDSLTLESLFNMLPDNPEELTRTNNNGTRSGEETNLEVELARIIEEHNRVLNEIKPTFDNTADMPYVQMIEGGIVVGGVVYSSLNIQGAMMIEVLNAKAEGVSDEDIESDIINICKEITEDTESISNPETRGHYTDAVVCSGKWPDGVVKYKFGEGMTDLYKEATLQAMRDWETASGGSVEFIEADQGLWIDDAWETIYPLDALNIHAEDFWWTDNANVAADSCVGRSGGVLQIRINTDFDDQGWDKRMLWVYVLTHELGHALGLSHEHQRWDRDNYITLNPDLLWNGGNAEMWDSVSYDKIDRVAWDYISSWVWKKISSITVWEYSASKGWYKKTYPIYGWAPFWSTYESTHTPTSYDIKSIMHYSTNDTNEFELKKNWMGLSRGSDIPFNQYISSKDILTIRELY